MKLCLDIGKFIKKPNKAETGQISKRIAQNYVNISLEELAKQITTPNGRTFTPAYFTGNSRTNDTWQGQQIFGLDFDKGITLEQIVERCQKYNILPSIIYETFSSVNQNKLRVLFTCEQEITDFPIRTAMQIALLTIFKESDKNCKDACRLFFGGKELVYTNFDARINPVDLILEMTRYIKDTDKNKNYSREIKEYCELVGLNMVNGVPKIIEQNNDSCKIDGIATHPIWYIKGCRANPSKMTYCFHFADTNKKTREAKGHKYKITNEVIKRTYLPRFDFDKLQEECKLWREFSCGQHWAYHNELTGMAMNLLWVKGGKERFLSALEQSKHNYNLNNWIFYCSYFVKEDYKPMACAHFCPHTDICEHGINMIETAKTLRGKVTVLSTPEYITLEQGEKRLKEAFQKAIDAKDNKVYVIKATTGIGKTELYLDLEDTTIALPTHKLKAEVAERMTNKGHKVTVMPSLPKTTPEIEQEIKKLYNLGAYSTANSYIRRLAQKEKMPEFIQYLKDLKEAQCSSGTILTTHERLLLVKDNNERIIIDEDIFSSLVQVESIKHTHLQAVVDKCTFKDVRSKLNAILYKVNSAGIGLVEEMPSYFIRNKAKLESIIVNNNFIKTNVMGFLNCSHFVKEIINDEVVIYFVTKRELPQKKTIILSATANEAIYKLMLGDRLKFIDIGAIEAKGTIKQYPQRSYSRYQMQKDNDLLTITKAIIGKKPVITYKEYELEYPNVIATFGATAGLDAYKGQDIYVVGTPHINPVAYLLIANALGKKPRFNDCNTSLEYQLVKRNGFQFYFNTFSEDDILREIQLYFIESELVQAIGRARILRNYCTVSVFSNLPIQGAEFIYLTKKEIQKLLEGIE